MEGPSPRVVKETKTLQSDPVPGIEFQPDATNYKHFFITLIGPSGTCYEGGKFKAELLLPDDYPMSPPKVIFDTKIYHPNIGTCDRTQTIWAGSASTSSRRTGRPRCR